MGNSKRLQQKLVLLCLFVLVFDNSFARGGHGGGRSGGRGGGYHGGYDYTPSYGNDESLNFRLPEVHATVIDLRAKSASSTDADAQSVIAQQTTKHVEAYKPMIRKYNLSPHLNLRHCLEIKNPVLFDRCVNP